MSIYKVMCSYIRVIMQSCRWFAALSLTLLLMACGSDSGDSNAAPIPYVVEVESLGIVNSDTHMAYA